MCLISLPLGAFFGQGRVDNKCLISLSLGVTYCRKGRQSSCDIFPLGAFSRRGELLLKPLAF